MQRTGTTRRGALTATGALSLGAVLTGCGNSDGAGAGAGGREGSTAAAARAASARANRTLRAAAARTSASLLARYDEIATAHPATAAGLAPLRSAVQAHAKALAVGAGRVRPPAPALPPATGPKAALKELAAEERRASDARTTALLTAEPELARLLASIAAAGAAHAYLLGELAKETAS